MFHRCHRNEKVFTEMIMRQMLKQVPHWKDNRELMKAEILRAIDNASYYEDDLFEEEEITKEEQEEAKNLRKLSIVLRKSMIQNDREVTSKQERMDDEEKYADLNFKN